MAHWKRIRPGKLARGLPLSRNEARGNQSPQDPLRPRLRPVAVDHKLAPSRGLPCSRSLGLRTEDRADMGQAQHRTWKISERPVRTLRARGERQPEAET